MIINILTFIFITLVFAVTFSVSGNIPEVRVLNGLLQGKLQTSRSGREFASYEGIPFGKTPIRFQPPQPAENWEGTRDATFPRSPCPQIEPINEHYLVDEDCLFLNVFVPKTKEKRVESLATMVWIHGGGFRDGAGSWCGPQYFMDEDIILVTLNYRLGAFGFLSTGDSLVPGNMGLKDQIMALKWVQENIQAFGGDPANVTIFGESAGGASVHHLMLSPPAKGLFQKVISQSGTALNHWSHIPNPKANAQELAKLTNCYADENLADAVKCLKNLPARELVVATSKIGSVQLTFGPTIDAAAGDYSVLPDTPLNLLLHHSEANSVNAPFVIGHNQEEGLIFAYAWTADPAVLTSLNLFWNTQAPKLLGYEQFYVGRNEEMDRVSQGLRQYYLKGKFVNADNMNNFTHLFSDVFMALGIKQSAIRHAKTNHRVYPYVLRYRGNFSIADFALPPGSKKGPPTHADDLQYLFKSLLTPLPNWPDLLTSSGDEKFSADVVKVWTSFARNGVPDRLNSESSAWNAIPKGTSLDARLQWYLLEGSAKEEGEDKDIYARMEFLNKLFDSSIFSLTTCPR